MKVGVLLGSVMLAGCFTARPDPTRFYVLTPITAADTPAPPADAARVVLGLGPITLPRYLDRSEVISRVGNNEIRAADFDRWAEPLHLQIARTLAEDLAVLGAVSRVVHHPWYRASDLDAVLELDVLRFERNAEGHALLAARWRLRCPSGGVPLHTEEIILSDPATAADAAAVAEALSRQVAELSRRAAAALHARPRGACTPESQRTRRVGKKDAGTP
jgi:hypothetical protein